MDPPETPLTFTNLQGEPAMGPPFSRRSHSLYADHRIASMTAEDGIFAVRGLEGCKVSSRWQVCQGAEAAATRQNVPLVYIHIYIYNICLVSSIWIIWYTFCIQLAS